MKLKHAASCLMATLIFLCTAAVAFAEPQLPLFHDVKGSFAETAITQLAEQGIISGDNSGDFYPDKIINRYDFTVLMAKTLGVQPYFPPKPTFSDIPEGTTATGYVEALTRLSWFKRQSDQLGATQPVLRQDAAGLLYRALGETAERESLVTEYSDVDKLSPDTLKAVSFVTARGWMAGSEGFFHPLQQLTRAEASVLAYRLLKESKKLAQVSFNNTPEQFYVATGETQSLDSLIEHKPQFFTPVYGLDSLAGCSVSPDGLLLTAGNRSGTGTLTVNSGNNYYTVITNVYEKEPSLSQITPSKDLDSGEKALAFTYRIEAEEPDPNFQQEEYQNHSGPIDGLTSPSDAWNGFLRQEGRNITVDLQKVNLVSKISLDFWQNPDCAVYLPKYIKGEVSVDGKCWYHLGHAYHGISSNKAIDQAVTLTLAFPPVNARYVKISFPVDWWVFARHLQVKGEALGGDPVILAPSGLRNAPELTDNISATTGDANIKLPSSKNILLVYTGGELINTEWTDQDFLPAVAYQDKSGLLTGKMFDTILFLPHREVFSTKADWTSYLDNLFDPQKQLHNLDEAVAIRNELPGLAATEKVILALPYPDANEQNFGSLVADEPSLAFSGVRIGSKQALQNRLAALQWFYNELMSRWEKAGFRHLELVGTCWNKEYKEQNIAFDQALVQNTARLVRNKGLDFYWLPSFSAQGFTDWKAYGFTQALLQPDYYTNDNPQEGRLDAAVNMARKYNMGIEIDFDDELLQSRYYYDLFYDQLNTAHQLGLDDGNIAIAYYEGLKAVVNTANSTIPQVRSVYDDLYRWINGTYIAVQQH